MEETEIEKDKGKLFVERVQRVLKNLNNNTFESLLEKVEEMRDLMITLTQMLKHSAKKIKTLEEEKHQLSLENKTFLNLVNEMQHHLKNSEINLDQFINKCQEYEELKANFDKVKAELSEIRDENDSSYRFPETGKMKSKKTQTNFQKNFKNSFFKSDNSMPTFDDIKPEEFNFKSDWNIYKLQTLLLQKEETWHQISGREREQRTKLCRLIKEMKILQNQLEWKNAQLCFKDAEIKDKSGMLMEAHRKIADLKKFICHNKRSKTLTEAGIIF